jgi:hypothetical protein
VSDLRRGAFNQFRRSAISCFESTCSARGVRRSGPEPLDRRPKNPASLSRARPPSLGQLLRHTERKVEAFPFSSRPSSHLWSRIDCLASGHRAVPQRPLAGANHRRPADGNGAKSGIQESASRQARCPLRSRPCSRHPKPTHLLPLTVVGTRGHRRSRNRSNSGVRILPGTAPNSPS